MGISTLVKEGAYNDRNLSLALGGLTEGVTPLELTSAYAVFANQGVYIRPYVIERIEDRNHQVIYQHRPEMRVVMDARNAYLMTEMLRTVITSGTGVNARLDRPAAGKTGTSSGNANTWFVGFTPDLVCSVWIGCDQNVPMEGIFGGTYPAQIWKKVMLAAHQDLPVRDFIPPYGTLPVSFNWWEQPKAPEEEEEKEVLAPESEPDEKKNRKDDRLRKEELRDLFTPRGRRF